MNVAETGRGTVMTLLSFHSGDDLTWEYFWSPHQIGIFKTWLLNRGIRVSQLWSFTLISKFSLSWIKCLLHSPCAGPGGWVMWCSTISLLLQQVSQSAPVQCNAAFSHLTELCPCCISHIILKNKILWLSFKESWPILCSKRSLISIYHQLWLWFSFHTKLVNMFNFAVLNNLEHLVQHPIHNLD